MIEEAVEIRTADGTCDGILFRPESGQLPGAIHLTDIGGIRESHRAMARRLAEAGFTVLMPNVFYRSGRPPLFDFVPKMGDARSMKRFGELATPMTPAATENDSAAYVDFLSRNASVSPAKIGVVGHCFTGAMAMRMAAKCSDRIGAAASFHGGSLYTNTEASPHLVLPRIKAPLYFGHAIEDQTMTADAIKKLEQALAAWGGKYESETYEGAYHGWTTPDAPVYNEAQANRAFEKLVALFKQNLK